MDKNDLGEKTMVERRKKLNKLPKGWVKTKGATTAPNGYYWANNGKSRFKPGRKNALIKENR